MSIALGLASAVWAALRLGSGWNLVWQLPLIFLAAVAAFFAAYLAVVGAISLFVSMKKRYTAPDSFFYSLLCVSYEYLWCLCGVRLHTEELPPMPEGRFLVVANHCSAFDHMLICRAIAREKLAFITKPENMKIPIGRRLAWRSCYIPIDREDPRKALASINEAAELIRSGAASVGVFPEGTRSETGELGEMKNGSFKIAQKAGCAIVVAVLRGTDAIHRNMFRRRTDVYLSVPQVITQEEISGRRTAEISGRVREIMENALHGGSPAGGKEKEIVSGR